MKNFRRGIKKALLTARRFFQILKANKFRLIVSLRGFLFIETKMYPNFKKDRKWFLSNQERLIMTHINDPNNALFYQLNSFYVFRNFVEYARVYGVYANGKFISYDEKIKTLDDVLKLEKIVFKAVAGGGGFKVFIIHKISDNLYSLRNKKYDLQSIKSFIESKDVYVFQEFVEQHPTINSIYSGSVNTLRLLTIRNDDKISTPIGILRVGSKKTGNVDNFSSGGISCSLDMETGRIRTAKTFDKKNAKLFSYERHPDTNVLFSGIKIPHFKEIVDSLVKAHGALVELKLIAWDVAVTENGYKIIEVNRSTDVNVYQIHAPLLKNKELYDFFVREGVVEPRKLKQ